MEEKRKPLVHCCESMFQDVLGFNHEGWGYMCGGYGRYSHTRFESDLFGNSERIVDAVEDALGFDDDVEAIKRSKQLWLVSNQTLVSVKQHRLTEPTFT
jgi:hypothetical protein